MFETLAGRYRGADPDALIGILCPILIPIRSLDKTIIKIPGQTHYRASFTVSLTDSNQELLVRGRTGKFVSREYILGEDIWKEIAKGRFINIDHQTKIAEGEVYTGAGRETLESSLSQLTERDYIEIDQYGAAAKVLSGLVEYSLSRHATSRGYHVQRMPEDMARHLGLYYHYDFEFNKGGVTKTVEVKSLWGTDTTYARLIHSKTKDYLTSSCKFDTQDIFAVSLFLRTGDIRDFAFARSVPIDVKPYGLPRASNYPEYVNQNPSCEIGDGTWFATIDEVWHLD